MAVNGASWCAVSRAEVDYGTLVHTPGARINNFPPNTFNTFLHIFAIPQIPESTSPPYLSPQINHIFQILTCLRVGESRGKRFFFVMSLHPIPTSARKYLLSISGTSSKNTKRFPKLLETPGQTFQSLMFSAHFKCSSILTWIQTHWMNNVKPSAV